MSRRKTIFVHGRLWHGHDCPKWRLPKSRLDYWQPKLNGNSERDKRTQEFSQRIRCADAQGTREYVARFRYPVSGIKAVAMGARQLRHWVVPCKELRSLGRSVLVIWQCETAGLEAVAPRLQSFPGEGSEP